MSLVQSTPIIFVLDLDGTIIGDCLYQVLLNNLDDVIKSNHMKLKKNDLLPHCYKSSSKLLRPYFIYFITSMQKHFQNCQFYVYTASDKAWANKEITMIEKTNNIVFNRPIFTRNDCIVNSNGQYVKSVKKILPKIAKNNQGIPIKPENILVIDNNQVFIDYISNLIICPSYNYLCFCDIWQNIEKYHLLNKNVKDFITSLVISHKACKFYDDLETNSNTLEQKHKWLYKKYKKINQENKLYLKDCFWKKLTNIIISKNITSFDKNNMETIHKLLCNKIITT